MRVLPSSLDRDPPGYRSLGVGIVLYRGWPERFDQKRSGVAPRQCRRVVSAEVLSGFIGVFDPLGKALEYLFGPFQSAFDRGPLPTVLGLFETGIEDCDPFFQ